MKNQKLWIVISGFMGFCAVALGAFGAHALGDRISAEMMTIYKTGILYQMIHSVAMLAVSLSKKKELYKSNAMFLTGIILFSVSLYVYAVTGNVTFAMSAPVGGVFFMIGWLLIMYEGIKSVDKETEEPIT